MQRRSVVVEDHPTNRIATEAIRRTGFKADFKPQRARRNAEKYKIMRTTIKTTLITLAGLGLMSLGGTATASALTSITGENAVTVNSASACAETPGQNDEQVD